MDLDRDGKNDFLEDYEAQLAMNGYEGIYGGHTGSHNTQSTVQQTTSTSSGGAGSSDTSSLGKMLWGITSSKFKKKVVKAALILFGVSAVITAIGTVIVLL